MGAVKLTISVNDGATEMLREIRVRLEDTEPLMKNLGEIALSSVRENFEVGGRPKWQPLAPATIKAKGHSKPLIASGVLRNVVLRVSKNEAIIGVQPSAKEYAAIQHFGGRAGRRRAVRPGTVRGSITGGLRSVVIPARPFMLLQDEDVQEMIETAELFAAGE